MRAARATDLDARSDFGGRQALAYVVALGAMLGVIATGSWLTWRAFDAAARQPGRILVPGGPLTLSHPTGERTVQIRTLEVDPTETTVAAYRACVDAGACKPPPPSNATDEGGACNWGDPAKAAHPMNCVTVAQAIDYCQWQGARLPTTNEWRYIAYGAANRKYPWGDRSPRELLLNACDHGCAHTKLHVTGDDWLETSPAGYYPEGATPEGVVDMAGNVEEWACNLSPDDEHLDEVACWTFVSLGGSWRTASETELTKDYEGSRGSFWRGATRSATVGFRCVR